MKRHQRSSSGIKAGAPPQPNTNTGIKAGAPPGGPKSWRKLNPLAGQSWWYALGMVVFVGAAAAGVVYLPQYLWPEKKANGDDRDYDPDKFPAPKLNDAKAPGSAPAGMAWIPGGEFYMGVNREKIPEGI